MGALLIPDMDDATVERLRAQADAKGRSLEAEVRDILEDAALTASVRETLAQRGLGSAMVQLFRDCPFSDGEITTARSGDSRIPDFMSAEFSGYDDDRA
jgi:plasmid stability protein